MMSKIAFVGTGLMGSAMAQTLFRNGHEVTVFNRTPEHAQQLAALGIPVADSMKSAVSGVDCVILMLSDATAIRHVLLSENTGMELLGKTVIQMGTISPEESRDFMQAAHKLGADYLEAPVLGSVPEARDGKLIVMVGSTAAQYNRWNDLLTCFGPHPVLVGMVGTAAALKLALNQLIASLTAAFGLSLRFIEGYGVPVGLFMEVLRTSALYAPTFDKKLERMLDHSYDKPNFPTKHLDKDVGLFIGSAKGLELKTDSIEGVRSIIQAALSRGLGETDYSSIVEAISGRG